MHEMNEWSGELFVTSTTQSLRATHPVPEGELVLLLLQFIHTVIGQHALLLLLHCIDAGLADLFVIRRH